MGSFSLLTSPLFALVVTRERTVARQSWSRTRDMKNSACTSLLEDVFQFGGAIGRVDRHHHQPGFGSSEIEQDPFGQVSGPDGKVITLVQSQRHQPSGGRVDAVAILSICPASVQRATELR